MVPVHYDSQMVSKSLLLPKDSSVVAFRMCFPGAFSDVDRGGPMGDLPSRNSLWYESNDEWGQSSGWRLSRVHCITGLISSVTTHVFEEPTKILYTERVFVFVFFPPVCISL